MTYLIILLIIVVILTTIKVVYSLKENHRKKQYKYAYINAFSLGMNTASLIFLIALLIINLN